VTRDYPPALLLHGDKDTDVPDEQSVLMSRDLERHEAKHEFVSMPNRGHGSDHQMQEPDVAAAFDHVMGFLKKYLAQ